MLQKKYRTLVILFVALSLCSIQFFCQSAWATEPVQAALTHEQSPFQIGVQYYLEKKFPEAELAFVDALKVDPYNISILTNLALVQTQLGKKGAAIATFRSVLAIDPGYTPALEGLKYVFSLLTIKEIPHQIEPYETLRHYLLTPVSLISYLLLTAFTLFGGGWLVLTYLGARKKSLRDEKHPPSVPLIAFLVLSLSLVFFALSLLKFYDSTLKRGTIVSEKVSVQALPGEGQTQIFDLYEGLEVIIRQKNQGWIQVSYPGGLTGWIPESSLQETKF